MAKNVLMPFPAACWITAANASGRRQERRRRRRVAAQRNRRQPGQKALQAGRLGGWGETGPDGRELASDVRAVEARELDEPDGLARAGGGRTGGQEHPPRV